MWHRAINQFSGAIWCALAMHTACLAQPDSQPHRIGAGPVPSITALAFSPSGTELLVGSQAGIDLRGWPELEVRRRLDVAPANIHRLVFSPAGTHWATVGGDPSETGWVEIFTWPACQAYCQLKAHDDSITDLIWLTEKEFVTVGLDRQVLRWKLRPHTSTPTTGMQTAFAEKVQDYRGHSAGVTSITRIDQPIFVTGGQDNSLRVWQTVDAALVRTLNQHTQPVVQVATRPASDGLPMIASAAEDRTMRFWQPTIGRMVRYARLPAVPLAMAWLPTGDSVVVTDTQGHVHLVDPETVTLAKTLVGIEGWAYGLAIHPTDGSLAVGGSNGQLRRLSLGEKP